MLNLLTGVHFGVCSQTLSHIWEGILKPSHAHVWPLRVSHISTSPWYIPVNYLAYWTAHKWVLRFFFGLVLFRSLYFLYVLTNFYPGPRWWTMTCDAMDDDGRWCWRNALLMKKSRYVCTHDARHTLHTHKHPPIPMTPYTNILRTPIIPVST